jgi:hypothetical protein
MTKSFSRLFLAGLAVVACALAVGAAGAQAPVEPTPPGKRVAIVVGNADYRSPDLGDLGTAARDGAAVAERLKRLNFTVFHATDVTRAGFEELVARAEAELEDAEALVLYYSGHGFQLDPENENYLVPVDFDATTKAEAATDALPLSALIERLSDRDRPLLIYLDACRNNPLPASVIGEARADGLAEIEVGDNVFVAFATMPGMIAVADVGTTGSPQLSPFTQALVTFIEQPGLSVFDLAIRVRNETEALTIGRQTPFNQDGLLQQFYFTEQQRIDPQLLLAGLRLIESDPVRKDRFRRELEANPSSLQALVMAFVSETPEVVTVAHNNLTTTDVKALAAPDLERLVREPAEPEAGAPIDLVETVQGELSRLGCYRLAIDGDWGKGSRKALADFYRETGQPATDLEPSLEALTALYMQSGRVCRAPAPVVRREVADAGGTSARTRGAAQPQAQRAARPAQPARKPLPLPPDIGAGIGIGGVF